MLDYLNIKEYPKDKGILLDSCNKEDRLYHNGCYYDLCGMSVQDYIDSTLLNCTGNGGGTTEPVKKINTITFTLNSERYLVVYANSAPKTDITISFVCEGNDLNVTIPSNNGEIITTNYKPTGETINIENVSITPTEDETYKYGDYKINDVAIVKNYTMYYNMVNILNIDSVSETDIVNYDNVVLSEIEQDITFILPASKENVDDLSDEEYIEWESNNSYNKIIAVPNELYTDENNRKFNYLINGVDAFIGFEKIKTIVINSVDYVILVDKDDVSSNSTMEIMEAGTYKVSLKI